MPTDVIIYHNPECGTSRNTLAMIRNAGIEPHVIEYLKTPPSREMLLQLIERAGLTPRELLREKGTPYAELGLGDPALSDEALVDAMMAHPVLINRPLVVTPLGYLIQLRFGGPPSTVTFLPSFWLLVPGALSLSSVTRMLSDREAGVDGLVTAAPPPTCGINVWVGAAFDPNGRTLVGTTEDCVSEMAVWTFAGSSLTLVDPWGPTRPRYLRPLRISSDGKTIVTTSQQNEGGTVLLSLP